MQPVSTIVETRVEFGHPLIHLVHFVFRYDHAEFFVIVNKVEWKHAIGVNQDRGPPK